MVFGPLLILIVLFAGRHHGPAAEAAPWLSRCSSCATCESFGGSRRHRRRQPLRAAGELHAMIGPNGAGKTTLIHQISGLRSDSGRSCSPARTSRACRCTQRVGRGLARSFQITSILPGFPRSRMSRSRFRRVRDRASASSATLAGDGAERAAMERLDAGRPAARATSGRPLSHGEKRQLELAIALATEPKLLLLDEPLAGTGTTNPSAWSRPCASEGPPHDRAGRARHGRGVLARRPRLACSSTAAMIATDTPRGDPGQSGGARRLSRRRGVA